MAFEDQGSSSLAVHLDYTLLKPDAPLEEIKLRCQHAAQLGLHGVSVHSSRVAAANLILEDSEVKVGCVVGFPFGAPIRMSNVSKPKWPLIWGQMKSRWFSTPSI